MPKRATLPVTPDQKARIDVYCCGCGCYVCLACGMDEENNPAKTWRPDGPLWLPQKTGGSFADALDHRCPRCGSDNSRPAPLPRLWRDGQVRTDEGWIYKSRQDARPDPRRKWATSACKARVHRDNKAAGRAMDMETRRRMTLLERAVSMVRDAERKMQQANWLNQEARSLVAKAAALRAEAHGQLDLADAQLYLEPPDPPEGVPALAYGGLPAVAK